MEQQVLHIRAIKSLHDYFKENKWEGKGSPLQEAALHYVPPLSPAAALLLERDRPESNRSLRSRHGPRPPSGLGELARPKWSP